MIADLAHRTPLTKDMLMDIMQRMRLRLDDFIQGQELMAYLDPDMRNHLVSLKTPQLLAYCLVDYLSLATSLDQFTFDFGKDNLSFWNECFVPFVKMDDRNVDTLESLQDDLGMACSQGLLEELVSVIGRLVLNLHQLGEAKTILPLLILLSTDINQEEAEKEDEEGTSLDRVLIHNLFNYYLSLVDDSTSQTCIAETVEELLQATANLGRLMPRLCPKVRRALAAMPQLERERSHKQVLKIFLRCSSKFLKRF